MQKGRYGIRVYRVSIDGARLSPGTKTGSKRQANVAEQTDKTYTLTIDNDQASTKLMQRPCAAFPDDASSTEKIPGWSPDAPQV